MSFKNISFILHKPQLSENVGACARAIKNFSFNKLILINPKPTFPNDKIIATSVGAKDIIKNAEVFSNIEDSINKIDILVATSARFRNKNIKHISIKDLNKIDFTKKIGFLFGSEASGLSNNEVSYADYTLEIPSNKNFRSLNLSHSLIIIAQIVSGIISNKNNKFEKSKKIKNASKKDINNMLNLCIRNLEEKSFFHPQEKKPIMLENLRSIFYKLNLSQKETRILSSVFAGLSKKKVDWQTQTSAYKAQLSMTKRLNSKHKVDRRLKVNLWGRPKSPFNSRSYPPGQHGQTKSSKPSDFGVQLQAKQKLKSYYGNMNERQFRNLYKKAIMAKGNTAENLIGLLERRLDAVVYRSKFANTIFSSRQLINHGHVKVNGKKVNISSYQVKEEDSIEIRDKSKQLAIIDVAMASKEREIPEYIQADEKNKKVKFVRIPKFEEVPYPVVMEPNLVVEYYSR